MEKLACAFRWKYVEMIQDTQTDVATFMTLERWFSSLKFSYRIHTFVHKKSSIPQQITKHFTILPMRLLHAIIYFTMNTRLFNRKVLSVCGFQ